VRFLIEDMNYGELVAVQAKAEHIKVLKS